MSVKLDADGFVIPPSSRYALPSRPPAEWSTSEGSGSSDEVVPAAVAHLRRRHRRKRTSSSSKTRTRTRSGSLSFRIAPVDKAAASPPPASPDALWEATHSLRSLQAWPTSASASASASPSAAASPTLAGAQVGARAKARAGSVSAPTTPSVDVGAFHASFGKPPAVFDPFASPALSPFPRLATSVSKDDELDSDSDSDSFLSGWSDDDDEAATAADACVLAEVDSLPPLALAQRSEMDRDALLSENAKLRHRVGVLSAAFAVHKDKTRKLFELEEARAAQLRELCVSLAAQLREVQAATPSPARTPRSPALSPVATPRSPNLDIADFDTRIADLAAQPRLERLEFRGVDGLDEPEVAALARCINIHYELEAIVLEDCHLEAEALKTLLEAAGGGAGAHARLRKLASLRLAGNRLHHWAAQSLTGLLRASPALTAIDLSRTGFSDRGMGVLASAISASGAGALRSLTLAANAIAGSRLLLLAQSLVGLPHFECLDLSDNALTSASVVGAGFLMAASASLTNLSLARNALSDAAAAVLAKGLRFSARITSLDVRGNALSRSATAALHAAWLDVHASNASRLPLLFEAPPP
ncbi:uncharacterized protein AMSG_04345 [Thecamonas trahens ATCC 50062]|uniref:Uncharacterized protein n=1 Tax=Thecamonas trahens ATCC 50062 TaxID=461836 RepID=A0A0L0D7F1_THETB|nr:hypothetical protein AMSG_04345 [Thecamonas trahens ATCC 50062]KNC48115.1 hypothetical protein AMSG_04345 [Thecamonas trahens ATCC 50062]|eukprot:XP_013758688.1 hypothetical protein AMSG_04345 [Thecamonas trahens ATCC 50062]